VSTFPRRSTNPAPGDLLLLDEPWDRLVEEEQLNIKFIVDLHEDERTRLVELTRGGKPGARKMKRAQILLMADKGATDEAIAKALPAGTSTVFRTRRRFVEGGLDNALNEAPRPGGSRKLSGHEEALLIATACSKPPAGCARWTLELLAERTVRLTEHESISRSTIGRRLHENELKPWKKRMWCIPKVNASFVAAMEDLLALYGENEPEQPVVCFDETPRQLIGETRTPIPPKPGETAIYDYEYRRNGTANLFVFVDAHQPWRHVKVTKRRTNIDFAECMRDLVDEHYPEAQRIRVVLDNLSTHKPGSLYEAFPPEEARRILGRLEFHFTPKHGSWLNMAEIEIGVLASQCLDRRIPDREMLESEVRAWQRRRNASGARINWMFRVENAREKLGKAYPDPEVERQARAA
jgi:transposase